VDKLVGRTVEMESWVHVPIRRGDKEIGAVIVKGGERGVIEREGLHHGKQTVYVKFAEGVVVLLHRNELDELVSLVP